jgi:hypothetical protein
MLKRFGPLGWLGLGWSLRGASFHHRLVSAFLANVALDPSVGELQRPLTGGASVASGSSGPDSPAAPAPPPGLEPEPLALSSVSR